MCDRQARCAAFDCVDGWVDSRHHCGSCGGRGWITETQGGMTGEFDCLDCNSNPQTSADQRQGSEG